MLSHSLFHFYLMSALYDGDPLCTGRSGDRIPVAVRISVSVQTDPATHPAPSTLGAQLFPGVKRPWRDVGLPPHLAPRLEKE
jgi:hypothetical protein